MKITNIGLHQSLLPALRELSTVRTNSKAAYNIVKTLKSAAAVWQVWEDARKSILESHADKDEIGAPKIDKIGQKYIFASEDQEAECLKSLTELGLIEVEIETYPIKMSDLTNAEFSAQTLLSLQEFIEE
jgi:hypothetical protein